MAQQDNVNAKAVMQFGLGLLVVGVAIHIGIALLFGMMNREVADTTREYPLAEAQEQRLPPEPRLQTNPRGDLRALRDEEDKVLSSYRWVDKSAGVVRIPIDEAMKLTIERGLPARPGSPRAK